VNNAISNVKKTPKVKKFSIRSTMPKITRNKALDLALALVMVSSAVWLTGCATTGAASPSARPVFYPNAKLNQVGQPVANADADACMGAARDAGLTPDEKNNAVAHDAAKGAAVGGVAGAVSGLFTGRSLENSAERGVAGAAVGGSVGAVNGAFNNKPSHTYRNYVQRCLKDKGYDVIGWN
jgi:hypothetical protein